MRITMLGTGNALVTKCYNTCFVIDGCSEGYLMGIIWMVRMICQAMSRGKYECEANIYAEAHAYFDGNVFVPNDLESIEL